MAFRRLQEEIIRRTNDTTIFAWDPSPGGDPSSLCSIFAPSPENFRDSNMIEAWSRQSHDPEYTLTNKGLRLHDFMFCVPADDSVSDLNRLATEYVLTIGIYSPDSVEALRIGLQLRKVGPDLFIRRNRKLALLDQERKRTCTRTPESPFYIMADAAGPVVEDVRRFRRGAIRFTGQGSDFFPHGLWDSVDQCFLDGLLTLVRGFLIRVALKEREQEMGVLIRWKEGRNAYDIRLFDAVVFKPQMCALFFSQLNFQETKQRLRWRDCEEQFPEMKDLTNKLTIESRGSVFVITATSYPSLEEVQGLGPAVEMFRFGLRVREETGNGDLIREMDGMELLC